MAARKLLLKCFVCKYMLRKSMRDTIKSYESISYDPVSLQAVQLSPFELTPKRLV